MILDNPREDYRKSSPHYAALLCFCEANRGNILAAIPFIGAEVAGHCGFAPLFTMIVWQGGWKIHVPARGAADSTMRRAVGDDTYAWMTRNYGGDRIEIPLCPEILRAYRTALVRRMIDGGATNWEIAESFSTSERTARRWRNTASAAERLILNEVTPQEVSA